MTPNEVRNEQAARASRDTLAHVSSASPEPDRAVPVRPQAEDDAQLIRRAQTGDAAAMGVLYDRYAARLFALALRVLGSRPAAEDLLHDVFFEAWHRVREYDHEKGSVRTWLFMRLRSRALDRLGRADVRLEVLDEAGIDACEAWGDPDHDMDRIALGRALDHVDPSVRQVIELTYFDGHTAAEIAARLGIPSGTVKSRLARGLEVLRAFLTESRASP